jgi:hypothetical protein
LVLENKLEVIKSGGYMYAANKTDDGYDLYRTFDSWDAIPVSIGVTADPAAGAQITAVAVPAGKRWLLLGFQNEIVASADVANRNANVYISMDGANNFYISNALLTVTASQTKLISACTNSLITAATTQYGMHIPAIELPAGATFRFYWNTLQAADNLGVMTYFYKEVPA